VKSLFAWFSSAGWLAVYVLVIGGTAAIWISAVVVNPLFGGTGLQYRVLARSAHRPRVISCCCSCQL